MVRAAGPESDPSRPPPGTRTCDEMSKIYLTVGLVVALAAPSALLAQQGGEAEAWSRVQAAYGQQTATQIHSIVQDAEQQGVPPGPLLNKALEGAAKGVEASRVLAVLSSLSDRLERAASLVGPSAGRAPDVLVAASDAMRRGVPDEQIQEIAGLEHDQTAIGLIVATDLVESGVSPSEAVVTLKDAMDAGVTGDQLLGVPPAVRRLIEQGKLPAQAVSQVLDAMARGNGPPLEVPGVAKGLGQAAGAAKGPPVPPGALPPGKGQGKGPPSGKGPP